jgi:hypothetical protein
MPPTPAAAGHRDALPAPLTSGGTSETTRRTGLTPLGSRRLGAAAGGRRSVRRRERRRPFGSTHQTRAVDVGSHIC